MLSQRICEKKCKLTQEDCKFKWAIKYMRSDPFTEWAITNKKTGKVVVELTPENFYEFAGAPKECPYALEHLMETKIGKFNQKSWKSCKVRKKSKSRR